MAKAVQKEQTAIGIKNEKLKMKNGKANRKTRECNS